MEEELRDFSRLTFLVGASVTESLGKLCVRDSVLPEGKSFIATATRFAPLIDVNDSGGQEGITLKDEPNGTNDDTLTAKSSTAATLNDLGMCLDPGLRHERIIVPEKRGLVCLARMLRKELRAYESDIVYSRIMDDNEEEEDNTTSSLSKSVRRPRVVIFFPGEEEARAAIEPMRDAMWGEHKLCVLLPRSGVNPLTIMEQFKTGLTSVMLATPNSVRGLDFPDLTHVYTLYIPEDDPREYLHLAGRVGRIGQMGSVAGKGGRVTSILTNDEAHKMSSLASKLNFSFIDIEYDSGEVDQSNVEDIRRYLEDAISLIDLAEEPVIDFDNNESSSGDEDEDE